MIKLIPMIKKEHRCKIRAWLENTYSLPPHSPSPIFANCTLLITGLSLKGLFSILIALNLTPLGLLSPFLLSSLLLLVYLLFSFLYHIAILGVQLSQ